MQSNRSRLALLAAALVIAVAAFLVLRPSDDDAEQAPTTAAERAEQAETGEDGGSAGNGAQEQDNPDQTAEPAAPRIEIRNGEVLGGVEEIQVERGERIEFVVESDAPDEIHVHGYELTEDVEPGSPARFTFPANLEGIYEVEAHDVGHVVIAEPRVTPS